MILTDAGISCVVFYGDWDPAFVWKDENHFPVLHLDRERALQAWKVTLDRDYLILSDDYVWEKDGKLHIEGEKETVIRCYPKLKDLSVLPEGFEACGADQEFTLYRRSKKAEDTRVTVMEENRNEDLRIYNLKIISPGTWRDTILSLDFGGDKIEIFRKGEMLTDSYYTGEPVQISLRYFDFPEELQVKIYPLKEGASKFLEHWPQMKDGCACELYVVGVKDLVW